MSTIKLTDPDEVSVFEVGGRISIDDLDYDSACVIFGQPLVDSYRAWKAKAPIPTGYVTVTGIDRDAGIITFDDPRSTSASPKGSPT